MAPSSAASAGKNHKPIFATAALSGVRLSECLGLVWGDVDFEQGLIHVHKQLSVPNEFDRTPPHRVDPKSDSDEGCDRWVFLDDNLAKLLKAHRGDRIPRTDEFVQKCLQPGARGIENSPDLAKVEAART